jgi:hypothetical protein
MWSKALFAQLWCSLVLLVFCVFWNGRWGASGPSQILVCAVGLAWIAKVAGVFGTLARGRVLALWAGLAAGVIMAMIAWNTQSLVIEGQRYWWLMDDAMVSMRYAKNLSHGLGLVWNQGERVEGYSNLLWTLGMGLPHWAGLKDAQASLPILAFACTSLLWLALATWRLAKALRLDDWAASLAACLVVLSCDSIGVARTGLESVVVTCLFCEALAAVWAREKRVVAAACVLLALLRFDGLLYVALAGLVALFSGEKKSVIAGLLLPALGAWLLVELWRRTYYGEWVPNTVLLKGAYWVGRFRSGAGYLRSFFIDHYPGMSLALPLGLWTLQGSLRLRAAILLPVVGVAAYAFWIGGDFMPDLRFLLPALPALAVLAAAAGAWLLQKSGRSVAVAAMLAVSFWTASPVYLFPAALDPSLDNSPARIRAVLQLRKRAPANAILATAWAGLMPYLWNGPAIDLLGKCDAQIARTAPHTEQAMVGHNKWDYPGSMARHPDFVHVQLPADLQDLPYYNQRLIEDPSFRRACRPQLVFKEAETFIFWCDWVGIKKGAPR